jgi:hypothetical protein
MSEEIQLTLGSKYLIKSVMTREAVLETEGTFRGITTIGTNDALVMELGAAAGKLKGKLRVIPTHMVVSIDIVESAKTVEKKAEDENVHYG